jgi:hypothetical protein
MVAAAGDPGLPVVDGQFRSLTVGNGENPEKTGWSASLVMIPTREDGPTRAEPLGQKPVVAPRRNAWI